MQDKNNISCPPLQLDEVTCYEMNKEMEATHGEQQDSRNFDLWNLGAPHQPTLPTWIFT